MNMNWIKQNKVSIIAIFAVAIIAVVIFGKGGNTLTGAKVSAPFDKFNYLYSVRETNENSAEKMFFYRNGEKLAESEGIKNGVLRYKPLFDGQGFYQLKYAEEGKTVSCGNEQLEKSTVFVGSNSTCITHNNQNYPAVDWPDYADKSVVVYQQCEKVKFYPLDAINLPGRNECQKFLLKLNDKAIDTASEYYKSIEDNGNKFLTGAAKFESIKVAEGKLTYLKIDSFTEGYTFVVYDLTTGEKTETKTYNGKSIANAQLVNGSPAFMVWNNDLSKDFFYQNQKVSNVDAFRFYEGDFYFVKPDPARKGISEGINLLKGDISLRHFDGNFFDISGDMIGTYPNCNFDSLICLYGNENFAAKSSRVDYKEPLYINSTTLPDDIFRNNVEDIFLFSDNGDTYIVYAQLNKVFGRNLDTGETSTLFEFNSSSNIDDLRVFPR